MDVLTAPLRERIDAMIASNRVVLFMKGSRTAPQCGFSASVVQILEDRAAEYDTVDILADMTLREGMKSYANWPTFPQLWVDGDLIGGADIVEQLASDGALDPILGVSPPSPPSITFTPAAAAMIVGAMGDEPFALRLRIDPRFNYSFEPWDGEKPDITVISAGMELHLDPTSARRADGITVDHVSDASGAGLVVDNPNEPVRVRQMSVQTLKNRLDAGDPLELIDVRTDREWNTARIASAKLLDPDTQATVEAMPRDTVLVFQCHHGVRSQHAAEHFLSMGFSDVHNLVGGIDAWSQHIDPDVPRY